MNDNADAFAALRAITGSRWVLTDPESLQRYGRDWTTAFTADPAVVVLPGNIGEVCDIVRWAAARGLAIVPSGGRTGLSGGAVAYRSEIVLALDRLNDIADFNPIDRTLRCGAGVTTLQVQQFAARQQLAYPVEFASSGASQVGGNIATNAGGIRVIRHGMTREHVAGLKLVTGTGELLDLNRGLVKNNAGYDLRHLVIGAEGTLGVVVEATLRLSRPPHATAVQLLAVPDMAAVTSVLRVYQEAMTLTACEFFCELSLQKVTASGAQRRPFATPAAYYVLIEFERRDEQFDALAMALFERCVAGKLAVDGVTGQSIAQAHALWRLREDISESIARWTPVKHDISVLVSRVPDLLGEVEQCLSAQCPEFEIAWFGHIGDGNVHLNILRPDAMPEDEFRQRCGAVSEQVFAIVRRLGGSISAEHGIGLLKKDQLHYSVSETEIAIMRQIKRAFDPLGIMNPGKIFD